ETTLHLNIRCPIRTNLAEHVTGNPRSVRLRTSEGPFHGDANIASCTIGQIGPLRLGKHAGHEEPVQTAERIASTLPRNHLGRF
ncbi:hypothetical protein ACPXAT_27115, partial [Klebsiella pneumoniae]|uniref:hypothetical protein n=1 Tax=Klebsiella pneumoniae TaxID=573 RepID=UPI003CF2FC84